MSHKVEEDKIGEKGEQLICSLVNNDQNFRRYLENCLKYLNVIPTECSGPVLCKVVKMIKTDIVVTFNCANSPICVGITVKTRRRGSRPDSHLDRRWLYQWQCVLNMPDEVYNVLHDGILRLAREKGRKKGSLVPLNKRKDIEKFLLDRLRKFLEESIRGGEHVLKVLSYVEYGGGPTRIHIFRVDDIIDILEKNIRERGIDFDSVIYLGDFMWIQRKGGNGKHVKIPKTDPAHPGNQLQVKIKMPLLVDHIEKNKVAPYCEPYYIRY